MIVASIIVAESHHGFCEKMNKLLLISNLEKAKDTRWEVVPDEMAIYFDVLGAFIQRGLEIYCSLE